MEPSQPNPTASDSQAGSGEIVLQDHEPSLQVSSKWIKFTALLGGIGLIATGLWLQQQDWSKNIQWLTWGVLVFGFLLFLAGQRINPEKQLPERITTSLRWLMVNFQINGWQLVGLVISPFLALVAFWTAGTGPYMNNPIVAIAFWVSAILVATLSGLWPLFPLSLKIQKRELALIGLLVLVASVIRGLYIRDIPIILSGDEASSGISAVAFINGDTNNIFRMGWYSFPAFHNWLQSIPIRIIGQNIPGLRFSSVFIGSITVGVVYLVAKALFGQRVGLYAAIFLCAHHFHHNFSRIGLNNIWDAFWFVTVLGSLLYGWYHEKRWSFILSGLALGFSQYFYVTSRLLFALIPAWLVVSGLFDRPRFRKLWPNLILLTIAALAVVIPLAGYYLQNPDEYFAPMVRVSILGNWLVHETEMVGKPGWLIILQQIGLSFLGLINEPLRAWYTPGVPLLRPAAATLFLIGLGTLLLKPRDHRFHLLGLWIIAICLSGGLSDSVPAAQRYVAIAPALAILIGFGLDQIAVQISQIFKRFGSIVHPLALCVIVIISLGELQFYYCEYTPNSDFGGANGQVAQRLAYTLHDRSSHWEVLFWGFPRMGYYSIPSIQYLVPEIKGLDMNQPWGSPQNPKPTSDYLIFILLPDHESELDAIRDDYPGGKLIHEFDTNGQTLYWLYEISPET
jgi:4-amino-4-deoxy-L-arabinose transferase-like glycosyltransferase